MIKLKLDRLNGPLLVFGLSKINIHKLQEGKPIGFNLQTIGLEGEIYIFAGDTEESMIKELEEAKLIPASKASTNNPN